MSGLASTKLDGGPGDTIREDNSGALDGWNSGVLPGLEDTRANGLVEFGSAEDSAISFGGRVKGDLDLDCVGGNVIILDGRRSRGQRVVDEELLGDWEVIAQFGGGDLLAANVLGKRVGELHYRLISHL